MLLSGTTSKNLASLPWNAFFIWLARNNKQWTRTTQCKVKDSLKETYNSPSPRPYLKQKTKPVAKANSICPVGFINKGNTCYANSVLQVLTVCLHSETECLQNQTICFPCYKLLISTWLLKRIPPSLLIHQTFYGP